jgi:hypothetical protein
MYSPWQAAEKTAICCVSEKIQTAYLPWTARPGFSRFLASHHFFSGLRIFNFSSFQLRIGYVSPIVFVSVGDGTNASVDGSQDGRQCFTHVKPSSSEFPAP